VDRTCERQPEPYGVSGRPGHNHPLRSGRSKEGKNERPFDVGDRGRSVVFRPMVAVAPIGHLDLNASGLLR
jgi:hypothetical protein